MNNIHIAQSIANKVQASDLHGLERVNLKERDGYTLLKYTTEAGFSLDMTLIEQTCRGLIVKDGKIIALAMPKFFNYGEPRCPPLPDEPYEVWEKVDGSLCLFSYYGGYWHCHTQGSFENEYTEFAMKWWKDHILYEDDVPTHWTVMCEAVLENDSMARAAYKPEGLYLIAVRDNYSGTDISLRSINQGLTCLLDDLLEPARFQLSVEKLESLKESESGIEGWVVRYESGLRVKIKTLWYLRHFRAISQLTPTHIRELMLEEGVDWISEFPDDLQPEAIKIQQDIESRFRDTLLDIHQAYSKIAGIESRKDYALMVQAEYPAISHWLFKLRDNRLDEQELLRSMQL